MKEWKIREKRLDKGQETPHHLKKGKKILKNRIARKMRLESVKEK